MPPQSHRLCTCISAAVDYSRPSTAAQIVRLSNDVYAEAREFFRGQLEVLVTDR